MGSLSKPNNPLSVNPGASNEMSQTAVASLGNRTLIQQVRGITASGSSGSGIPKPVTDVKASVSNASAGVTSVVNVQFRRDPSDVSFSGVNIYAKGYHGNQTPVLVGSSTDSPATFILDNTGESISLIVQATGNGGSTPLATCPSVGLSLAKSTLGGVGTSTKTSSTSTAVVTRKTVSVTTSFLAPNAAGTGTVALAKTLGLISVTASSPCRIRLYSTAAALSADSGRGLVSPTPFSDHGIIADILLNKASNFSGYQASVNTIGGTVMPWNPVSNPSFDFGDHSGASPVVALTGLTAGQTVLAACQSAGGIVIHTGTAATVDGIGNNNALANNNFSGTKFPDYYVGPVQGTSGILHFGGIIGAFTDGSGIVKSVAEIGNSGTFVVPVGATQFQIGINDVPYSDNSGSATVSAAVISGTRTWVLSPEAVGSNAESPVSGSISYSIQNLSTATMPVTVSFTVLAEES